MHRINVCDAPLVHFATLNASYRLRAGRLLLNGLLMFRRPLGRGRSFAMGMVAERKGFEPSIRVNVYALSRGAPSATRPPLHGTHGPKQPRRNLQGGNIGRGASPSGKVEADGCAAGGRLDGDPAADCGHGLNGRWRRGR